MAPEQPVAAAAGPGEADEDPLGGVVRACRGAVVRAGDRPEGAVRGLGGRLGAALGVVEAPDVPHPLVVVHLAGGRDEAEVREQAAGPAGAAQGAEAQGAGAVAAVHDHRQAAPLLAQVDGGEHALAAGERDRDPGLVRRPEGGAEGRLGQGDLDRGGHRVRPRGDARAAEGQGVVVGLGGEEADRVGGAGARLGIGAGLAVVAGGEDGAQVGPGREQLDHLRPARPFAEVGGALAAPALHALGGRVVRGEEGALAGVAVARPGVGEEEDHLLRLVEVVHAVEAAAGAGLVAADPLEGDHDLRVGPARPAGRGEGGADVPLAEVALVGQQPQALHPGGEGAGEGAGEGDPQLEGRGLGALVLRLVRLLGRRGGLQRNAERDEAGRAHEVEAGRFGRGSGIATPSGRTRPAKVKRGASNGTAVTPLPVKVSSRPVPAWSMPRWLVVQGMLRRVTSGRGRCWWPGGSRSARRHRGSRGQS